MAYEALQHTLVKFFDWRGAGSPEECAADTLDRLAGKLDEGIRVDDVSSFALGIARLVLLEEWRRADARAVPADQAHLERLVAPEAPEEEPRRDCLDSCLEELPLESRDLVLQYYVDRGPVEDRQSAAAGPDARAFRQRPPQPGAEDPRPTRALHRACMNTKHEVDAHTGR